MYVFHFLFLILFVSSVGVEPDMVSEPGKQFAGEKPLMTQTTLPDTISFELTDYNNIVVNAVLNETDTVRLMLHTAASGVTLIGSAGEKLKSIHYNDRDTVQSWGGASDSRYSRDNRLQIGRQQWEGVTIWENEHSGQTTDGKVGLFMFADRIVELDYEARQLILYEELPAIDDSYTALDLTVENGLPFIDGSIVVGDQVLSNRFLIHSGYSGAILLDDEFVAEHSLTNELEITDSTILKDSYGNELKTLKAILPAFMVGYLSFDNIPVGFFDGAIGRQKMSVMGGDVLKRFNLIFDLKHAKLYLRRNGLVKTVFRE
ncbi:MAG: hypothetical protein R2824_20685 [Saprospiraceae bacterium]|nr:hypothetical protein [Lewinella sp.]